MGNLFRLFLGTSPGGLQVVTGKSSLYSDFCWTGIRDWKVDSRASQLNKQKDEIYNSFEELEDLLKKDLPNAWELNWGLALFF